MSAGIVEVEIELKEGKLPDAGVWLALHEQRVADGCKPPCASMRPRWSWAAWCRPWTRHRPMQASRLRRWLILQGVLPPVHLAPPGQIAFEYEMPFPGRQASRISRR